MILAATSVCLSCGGDLDDQARCLPCLLRAGLFDDDAEVVPEGVGDYAIDRREDGSPWELGRGAMGVTYRATDRRLHRQVALKVVAVRDTLGERFLREARATAALHHPNVAEVFQFGVLPESGRAFYAMELIDGETLEARVRRSGPLEVLPALHIAMQVAHALIATAKQNLVHRDLKPGNIMLSAATDRVTVIDFGLAKNLAGIADPMNLTHDGFVGTPAFASPEQFSGNGADARSDIYSLGVTLWYALMGEAPFPGRTIEEIRRAQSETPLPLAQLTGRRVPPCTVALLRRTLSNDPAGRPPSALAMLAELERCHRIAARAERRGRRLRRALILGGALAGVFILVGSRWLAASTRHPLTERKASAELTSSPPAYQAYLRGASRLSQESISSALAMRQSEKDFQQAIQLDPKFVEAWTQLSIVYSSLCFAHEEFDLTPAKQALDTVAALAPGSGEFFLAQGYYHYRGQRRFFEAIQDFTQATLLLPNRADAYVALGYVQRRLGRWEDSLASFTQAARIDPLNLVHLAALNTTYRVLGRYEEARAMSDQSLAIAPDSPKALIFKAMTYQWEGDVASAARLLGGVPLQGLDTPARVVQMMQCFYERSYDRIIAVSRDALHGTAPLPDDQRLNLLTDLGEAQRLSGDLAGASATLREARRLLAQRQPAELDAREDWNYLAWLDALLGDRAAALRESRRAIAQSETDSMVSGKMETAFAKVLAQLDDAEGAIARLPKLLSTPGSELTAGLLRVDPVWDPIRADPRFVALSQGRANHP